MTLLYPKPALQILTLHKFHCDIMCTPLLPEIEHLTDIFVPDLAGKLQFVAESFKGFLSLAISGLMSFRAIFSLIFVS